MEQRTLANSFALQGIGIHTGEMGRIVVHPADADTGRVFRAGGVTIPARADYVVDTSRCTTLGAEGARVSTVEHLLSALHGLCVDNAIIEIEGPEIPILDGSAVPFVEAIQAAGIVGQGHVPRVCQVTKSLDLQENASWIRVYPDSFPQFPLEVVTEFAEWPEGRAVVCKTVGEETGDTYASEIAPARTFAFRHEVEMLIAAGLAKGGSLDNALIITPPDQYSSPLRLESEWCRHKVLDVIGDLALVDARLQANVIAHRPGHRLNVRIAQEILKQQKSQEEQERS